MRHTRMFALLLPPLFFVTALVTGLMESDRALAQAAAARMRGEIVSISGTMLQIKTDDGQTINVRLAEHYAVSARSRADPASIAAGTFLGATALPGPDGTLVASEVHIFPESMRGTGEGHRPMDAGTGSTMTNATVASVGTRTSGRTMTNATVTTVAGDQEKRMTLKYAGGEKLVTIPRGTPIVMVEAGDATMLVPGAHAVVSGMRQSDGSLLADRIQVGRNGFVPPL